MISWEYKLCYHHMNYKDAGILLVQLLNFLKAARSASFWKYIKYAMTILEALAWFGVCAASVHVNHKEEKVNSSQVLDL